MLGRGACNGTARLHTKTERPLHILLGYPPVPAGGLDIMQIDVVGFGQTSGHDRCIDFAIVRTFRKCR